MVHTGQGPLGERGQDGGAPGRSRGGGASGERKESGRGPQGVPWRPWDGPPTSYGGDWPPLPPTMAMTAQCMAHYANEFLLLSGAQV